jgi:hypothetical protein
MSDTWAFRKISGRISMLRNTMVALAGAVAVVVGFSGSAEAATQISFGDFTDPIVIDFEDIISGPIQSDSPFFTNQGIASVTTSGGTLRGDIYGGTAVMGNGLASVNGGLAVVSPGDPLDDGTILGSPEFIINFRQSISKFGATLTDQFGPNFRFTFLSNGVTVDEFNFEIVNGDFNSATPYIQADSPFNSVQITHPSGTGGYGVDNITFERISSPPTPVPEPASLLGLAAIGATAAGGALKKKAVA